MTVKIKIDSAEVEVSKDVADHIGKLKAKADAANAKVDSVQAECDALKAKVDSMPKEIEKAVAKAKEDAAALASLVATAAEAGVKTDGLDAKGIKVAYVKEVSGLDVAEKSDAYIDAAFDIAKDSDNMAEVRIKTNTQGKIDSKKDDGIELDPRARLSKLNK